MTNFKSNKMRNLRKFFMVVVTFISTVIIANAQGAYVNVDVGYNLSAGSAVLGTNETTSNEEIVKGSFGKGISFGLGVGYMFNENVGAEIGFSYLSGSKFEFTDNDGTTSSTTEAKGKMMRITPALKVTAGESIKPYAKFGVVIGMAPKIEAEETGSTGFGGSFTSTDELSGGMAIGLMGAAGVDFKLSDMISIFVELNSISQSWAPDKDKWTHTESVGGLSDSQSGTINYEDNISASNTDPNVGLKMNQPFSSFGIHAGVKLSFGGK